MSLTTDSRLNEGIGAFLVGVRCLVELSSLTWGETGGRTAGLGEGLDEVAFEGDGLGGSGKGCLCAVVIRKRDGSGSTEIQARFELR